MLRKITDLRTECPVCRKKDILENCEPDIDGDGSPGCAECKVPVKILDER